MDAKRPALQRLAEKLAAKIGVEECRFTSASFSNCDFEVKDSKLITLLTFGRVLGVSIDLWADSDNSFTARVKMKVDRNSQ
jgi:hypothetical protein